MSHTWCVGRAVSRPLAAYLVLALEDEHVGDLAEGHAEVDDLSLADIAGDVSDVHHAAGFVVQFHLKQETHRSASVSQGNIFELL